jgi:hypothetical protein
MAWAASGGQEAIMRLCHDEWGADNVKKKDAINWAAYFWPRSDRAVVTRVGAADVNIA